MPGSLQVPSLEELDVQEVSERPPAAGPFPSFPFPRGAGRRPLPLCPAVGGGQLGRAEGRGPPLRRAVRPPQ